MLRKLLGVIALKRTVGMLAISMLVNGTLAAKSQAKIIFETATQGPSAPIAPDNYTVTSVQFLGARFVVDSTVKTTSIGGHFISDGGPAGNGKFFGGIVALTTQSDFPDSIDLSTPDVLGTTLLTFPDPSSEVSAPLEVTLSPGIYAVVFGTGLFGATSSGAAKSNYINDTAPT